MKRRQARKLQANQPLVLYYGRHYYRDSKHDMTAWKQLGSMHGSGLKIRYRKIRRALGHD